MIERVTTTRTGNLQVHREDYLKDRSVQQYFTPSKELVDRLPAGSSFSERTYLPSMLSSGEQSATLMLMGIRPSQEARVTTLATTVKSGAFLEDETASDCPSRQILIGRALAEYLHVGIDNKIVVMTQAADGTLGNDLFRVKGIFDSGSPDMDKAIAYAPLECVAKVGALQGIHEAAIRLPEDRLLASTQEALEKSAGPHLKVTTWREAMPTLASVIRLNDGVLLMISMVLFIVITMGIINVLLIGIFERTREFGVMIALGTTPVQLKSLIFFETALLASVATLAGTILGYGIVLYHQRNGFDLQPFIGIRATVDQFQLDFLIFPVVQLASYAQAVGATFIFVLIAGVYPAFRASALNPVEAMRSV